MFVLPVHCKPPPQLPIHWCFNHVPRGYFPNSSIPKFIHVLSMCKKGYFFFANYVVPTLWQSFASIVISKFPNHISRSNKKLFLKFSNCLLTLFRISAS
jgi:hypothetical protein